MAPVQLFCRKWAASRGGWLAWLGTLGGLIVWSSPWHTDAAALHPLLPWLSRLASEAMWLYAGCALLGGLLAVLGARWIHLLSLPIMAACWSAHLPAARASHDGGSPSMTVATANLHYENRNFGEVLRWLSGKDAPDVVVLQELSPAMHAALSSEDARKHLFKYRLQAWRPQEDQFGMAVLSRWPAEELTWVEPETARDTLTLRARLRWGGRALNVTAVHPMPPVSPEYERVRDSRLLFEAKRLTAGGLPGVLLGDLNTTPWSAGMRALEPLMNRATPLWPTWPNVGGVGLLPLDHVLMTRGIASVRAGYGPDVGSDHRPAWTRIQLRP